MGDRRRMTPKAKGKAPIASSTTQAPDDLPEDLPPGFPFQFSWEINDKMLLLKVMDQGSVGSCWTVVYNRMIAAHLFLYNKVPELLELSAKHLYAHIHEKFPNGFLKNYNGLKTFLKEEGLVREQDCKCSEGKRQGCDSTVACDKVKGKKVFKIRELIVVEKEDVNETDIIRLLKTLGPIAAEIEVTGAYSNDYEGIYYGPSTKYSGDIENHIVLLTKYSTEDGVSYFQFQNTWGTRWGENGYGKLARKISLPKGKPSLIKSYMYPELLDQGFHL